MATPVVESNSARETQVIEGLRTLFAWAAEAKLEDIPPSVLRKAVIVVADDASAMVAARADTEVQCVHEQLLADGSGAQATVFRGGRPRTGRISAALANGIAGSWCELDEGYRLAPCHAGLYTLPSALAEAETFDLTVAQLLRALVLSYEVTARIARCWIFPQLTLHPHPQSAAIGGAAASALARGFDAQKLGEAVTAAASLITVGDYRHAVEGALVRNVWAAVGCSNGMRAADWALCGIGGALWSPQAIYTGLLGQPPQPEALTTKLGSEWAITKGYHKVHACCQSTHSAVEAMLLARERLPRGKAASDVSRIQLATHRPGMSNKTPASTLAARFSFEHVLAATCVYGEAGAQAFSTAALVDPEIARLREAVELRPYSPGLPRPHDRPARVTLQLSDGETITAECLSARGGPDQPFEESVILDKAKRITGDVYPAFLPTMCELAKLEPHHLNSRWRETVEALTAGVTV